MALRVMLAMLFVYSYVRCETTTESPDTLLQMYSNYAKSSLELEKNDRRIIKGWFADLQVQQVNITTHYRLQMARHKEHSFQWVNGSTKWNECKDIHSDDIMKSERLYYEVESACLMAANAPEGKSRHAVYQVDKEIKKWRKSYRYLVNQCKSDHPADDAGAASCLVEYMTRDNYHVTFQRLILLKLESMSELFAQIVRSLHQLEECLKSALSQYLSDVRVVTQNLHQCYNIKNKT